MTNDGLGVLPGAEVIEDESGRPIVVYHSTDGSDRVLTYGEFVAATKQFARDCVRGEVAADLPQTTASPEPEPRCLGAGEIREELISRRNPDRWAVYFDSADVQTQGIPGGPGYEVYFYDEYGQLLGIWPKRGINGRYGAYLAGETRSNDDTTFTEQQFVQYSRFEARRCRRET